MRILRPKYGTVTSRRGKDNAVGHGQLQFTAEQGGLERKGFIQRNHHPMPHKVQHVQRLIAGKLVKNALVDLVYTEGRNHERIRSR